MLNHLQYNLSPHIVVNFITRMRILQNRPKAISRSPRTINIVRLSIQLIKWTMLVLILFSLFGNLKGREGSE